ncbi:MAG: oligosaccharide flippase family protein [Myxococcales bacterium]|nr:oligosaccharide flippase family protein [Myxococcales bacterium]
MVTPKDTKPTSQAQAAEAARQTAGARARRSIVAVLGGMAGQEGLRFLGHFILVRLLPREAFGIVLLVNVVLRGFRLFSDVGIGPSIIQSPDGGKQEFLDTAWTVQVVRGVVLFLATVLFAAPIAAFYEQPILASLLPAAAISMVLQGLNSTKIFSANRELTMGRVVRMELSERVAALIVMVAWARISPTVWALVAGGVVAALVTTVLSHLSLPGPGNRLRWDRDHLGAMLSFGRWVFLGTVITFLASELDSLMFGKWMSMSELGVYAVAITLTKIPERAIAVLSRRIVFPLYADAMRQGHDIADVFARSRTLLFSASGWLMSGIAGGGAVIVAIIYPAEYADAGWILSILALRVWIATLADSNSNALLAAGLAKWNAAGWAIRLAALGSTVPLGFWLGGFPMAVVFVAASELPRYVLTSILVYPMGLHGRAQDAGYSCLFVLASALSWASVHVLRQHEAPAFVLAPLVFVLCSAVWAPKLLPVIRAELARRHPPITRSKKPPAVRIGH